MAQVFLEWGGFEVEYPAAVLQLEAGRLLTCGCQSFDLDIGIERLKPAVDLQNQFLAGRLGPRPSKIDFQKKSRFRSLAFRAS